MKSVFTCGSVSDGATTNFVNPAYPEWDTNAGNSRTKNHICTFLLKIPDDAEDICQVNIFCFVCYRINYGLILLTNNSYCV